MENDKESGRDKDTPASEGSSEPENPAPVELSDIEHPGVNDVMFGRGGDTNYHIGNHRFRMLADEYSKQYHEASRKQKALIVQKLVDTWKGRSPPGRFLTRTDPSQGEDSRWHDVGTAAALKKAAKILSERSSEFRTGPSSRKRKSDPQSEAKEPPQQIEAVPQPPVQPTFAGGPGGAYMQQQPTQWPAVGQMIGYQVNYPTGQSAAQAGYAQPLPRAALSPNLYGEDPRVPVQGVSTQQAMASAVGAAASPLEADNTVTGGVAGARLGSGANEGQSSNSFNDEDVADDDSPESISQDSSAGKKDLPSAASLSGVFTSSSSDTRGKDSSPSTDEKDDSIPSRDDPIIPAEGLSPQEPTTSAAALPEDGDTGTEGAGSSRPRGNGRGENERQSSNASNGQETDDDDSPEPISQSSAGKKESLPSAASLAGIFKTRGTGSSSSSDARRKDRSPSTDES